MSDSCPRLGFEVTFHLAAALDTAASNALQAAFTLMLAAGGLSSRSGPARDERLGYIIWRDGSQAEHADREAIREWAENQREIISAAIGDLIELPDTF